MKLTQKLIDKIQEAMLHTNLKGEINWKDGEDVEALGDFGEGFDAAAIYEQLDQQAFEESLVDKVQK